MSLVEYELVEYLEVLRAGDGEVLRLKIAALADFDRAVDQMFQALLARGEAERLHELCPFFGNLWPAARGLARFLAGRGRPRLQGRRLLEVGCGLALPGLTAAAFGASVTLSDGHPEVPYFLERNLRLNDMPPVRYCQADWSASAPEGTPLGEFDLVVGSDVLYERSHPELLADFVERHLAPKGEVVIADPGRAYLQDFERCMRERGFATKVDAEDDIFILTLRTS